MAGCHGFSASLMPGVPKTQFPGLGDAGFSWLGWFFQSPAREHLSPTQCSTSCFASRNQPDQTGCQQSSSCLIGHQHSFAINFHCSLSLGIKDIPGRWDVALKRTAPGGGICSIHCGRSCKEGENSLAPLSWSMLCMCNASIPSPQSEVSHIVLSHRIME